MERLYTVKLGLSSMTTLLRRHYMKCEKITFLFYVQGNVVLSSFWEILLWSDFWVSPYFCMFEVYFYLKTKICRILF